MLKFINQKPIDLKGCLLIVSGISIGNVPALTCDKFISKNNFLRIGYFQSRFIQPSIGYLPPSIQNGRLGLPIQLYQKGNTLILQFRSYVRFARKKDLTKQIVGEFRKLGVEEIVLISSLPFEIRPDLEIGSVENNVYFKNKGKVSNINLVQNIPNRLLSISHLIDDQDLEGDLLKYGGLAYPFYQEADNIIVLFIFSQQKQNQNLVSYYERYLVKLLGRKQIV